MKQKKSTFPYLWVLLLIALLGGLLIAQSPAVRSLVERQCEFACAEAPAPAECSREAAEGESSLPSAIPLSAASKQETTSSPLSLSPAAELPRWANEQVAKPEQIIHHIGYTVSWNPVLLLPNWVAYELTADELIGSEERTNHFKPDPLVEGDPVVTRDYSNSGYDRGHMAPAADMRWSAQAMRESFYMTNICPQNHNLNAGDWKVLEERVRDMAEQYEHVYVCCGPIISDPYQTIGQERKIAVPEAFFKVVLTEQDGEYQTEAYVMNNEAGHKKLSTYKRPLQEVETITGLQFFYAVLPHSDNPAY